MDSNVWDERYAGDDLVWSAQPNRFLVVEVETLPPGRALDLACGEGRNAVWLAERGWDVTGVDFSNVGLDKARRLADARDRDLGEFAAGLHSWRVSPTGTEGYRKAEVTVGGVDTRELDSRSLESRLVAGLHFIGEVVDVTGWLGGYNFQWAWASAAACAHGIAAVCGSLKAGL